MEHAGQVEAGRENADRALQRWTTLVTSHIGRFSEESRPTESIRCESLSDGFHARLEHGAFGDLHLCRVTASPHAFARHPGLPSAATDRPWMLMLQLSGITLHGRGELTDVLGPEGAYLIDCNAPFTMRSPQGCDTLLVLFPAGYLPRGAAPGLKQGAMVGMMHRLISDVVTSHDRIDADTAHHLSRGLGGLLTAAAAPATPSRAAADPRRALYGRIVEIIDGKLTDMELTLGSVAEAAECSVRTLHRVFEAQTGVSASAYLWQRRLARCAAALEDPTQADRSITDIAFGCGFNSSAHFSRMFRDVFATSPSAFRRAAASGAPGQAVDAPKQAGPGTVA